MAFSYEQATGNFYHDGELLATGYSGYGADANVPQDQDLKDLGPIPVGSYTIGEPHVDEQVGPVAMTLTPAPTNEMFGRGSFLVHGDTAAMNHTASHGCIILNHDARVAIGTAVLNGDNQLEVVA